MRSSLVFPAKRCKSGLPSPRSIPSASTSVSMLDVKCENVAHLDTIVRSRVLVHNVRNLRCWPRAINVTLWMFGRVKITTPSLHRHTFHSNGKPNFSFSALNGMRNVANSH